MKKNETLQEFIARGGSIKNIPYSEPVDNKQITANSTSYSPHLMDLDEGGLFFAQPSKNKKNKTTKTKVKYKEQLDVSKLPEHLKKYL